MKQEKFLNFAFSYKGSGVRAFVFFFCVSAFGAVSSATTIICKNDKSVRTLRADTSSGGCRAVYTKLGVDQIVGSSVRENGCDTILEGIRKTLEGSVWKCRDIQKADVSTLTE